MNKTRTSQDVSHRPRTIGVLAKEAGVSVETIRFYEREGLLRKSKAPSSGWRVYDDSAFWVVYYLKSGRELGFTLAEMKKVMAHIDEGKRFCASVQHAYEDKIRLLEERIRQLRGMQRELKKAHRACIVRSAGGDCPIAQRCGAHFKNSGQLVALGIRR